MQTSSLPVVVVGGRLFREVDFGEHGIGHVPIGPLEPPARSEVARKSADSPPPDDDNRCFDSLWPFVEGQQVEEKTADSHCLDGHIVGPLECFYGREV